MRDPYDSSKSWTVEQESHKICEGGDCKNPDPTATSITEAFGDASEAGAATLSSSVASALKSEQERMESNVDELYAYDNCYETMDGGFAINGAEGGPVF